MEMHNRRILKKTGIYLIIVSLALFIAIPSVTLAQLSGAALTEAQQAAAQAGQTAAQTAIGSGATASEAATAAATAAANSAAAAGASATHTTAAAQAAASAATTAAQQAATTAGAGMGTATTGAISSGTISVAAVVAAAIAGIAITSGSDDVVIAAAAPAVVPDEPEEPTVAEAVDDLIAALDDSDQLALASLMSNQSAAEQAAFAAFITELDAGSLAVVQSILAGATQTDLEAVIAALTADGELTRGILDDGYKGLENQKQQTMYESFMELSDDDRKALEDLAVATIARGGTDALTQLAAVMDSLDPTKLAAVKAAVASGDISKIIEAILTVTHASTAYHVVTDKHGVTTYHLVTTIHH